MAERTTGAPQDKPLEPIRAINGSLVVKPGVNAIQPGTRFETIPR
jgi:hypothetical protein